MQTSFAGTRRQALQRLTEFLPALPRYASVRNTVDSEHAGVSRLSPAVRCRLIAEEEIVARALEKHPFGRIEKFLQEVLWRTYWKSWLELRPQVWRDYRQRVAQWQPSEPELEVMAGKSGVAIIDYFTRELLTTGYLHNHARMWFASYWVHVAQLPWWAGAEFFYRHLLDADPASNTLSWRWVAGLQTRGKTYLVRRSNIAKYAPDLLEQWSEGAECLEDSLVRPVTLTESLDLTPRRLPASHNPDLTALRGPVGWWLHGEDLSCETVPWEGIAPSAVLAVTARGLVEHYALSEPRRRYLATALADAIERAAEHWNCPATHLEAQEIAPAMCQWALEHRLKTIVTMHPPVGPLAEAVPEIESLLAAQGCSLVMVRREWDWQWLPLAKSGFFGFWEKAQRELQHTRPKQLALALGA